MGYKIWGYGWIRDMGILGIRRYMDMWDTGLEDKQILGIETWETVTWNTGIRKVWDIMWC